VNLKLNFFFCGAAALHWQRASARAGGGGGQAAPAAGRSKLFLHCVTCEPEVEYFFLRRRRAALHWHWQRAALRAGGGGGQAAPAAGRSSDITYEIT